MSVALSGVSKLELCVTQEHAVWRLRRVNNSRIGTSGMRKGANTHLVCVPEPGCSFLFAAHQRDPFTTAATQSFPNVHVAFGSSSILRSLECSAGRCANAVCKRLVIPECAVLEHKPSSWLTQATPPLALVAMTPDPPWGIEIASEAQILFVWNHVWVGGVHVRFRRVGRFFV